MTVRAFRAARSRINRTGAAALAIGLSIAACLTAQPLAAADLALPPEPDGYFTPGQAESGRRVFNNHCAACHGLTIFRIFRQYPDAARFYNFMSGSMPRHAAGSLPEDEYVAILAWLLRELNFPPGDVALTADRAFLQRIVPGDPER